MNDTVRYDIIGEVGHLIFNQPKALNSLTPKLVEGVHQILDQQVGQSQVRALLLRGEGPCFCAGGNLDYFQEQKPSDELANIMDQAVLSVESMISKLLILPIPVVAMVHGSVAGAGLSIMLSADIIVAADDCQFTTAYTKIGLSPDGGSSYLLPRAIGPRKALEWFLTNTRVDAKQALAMGLVNQVVEADHALKQATELATMLAKGPTLAFAKAKKLVQASLNNGLEAQYAMERPFFVESFATADFQRGLAAFLSKQPAHFEGK